MVTKAITKIKTEMEQNKTNSYVHVVGGFLLQHLDTNPQDAEKVMAEGKTVAKSLDEMRKVAEKSKVGNCAVLTDQEGFEVILKYFGIDGAVPAPAQAPPPVATQPAATLDVVFDIKLEDLL